MHDVCKDKHSYCVNNNNIAASNKYSDTNTNHISYNNKSVNNISNRVVVAYDSDGESIYS